MLGDLRIAWAPSVGAAREGEKTKFVFADEFSTE